MLMDALDGTLSVKEKAAFELHIATCSECSQMLADAKRGAAMLEILKSPRPEPSAALLERILSQTSGAQTSRVQTSRAQASGLTVAAKSSTSGLIALPAGDGAAVEIHSVVPGPAVPSNVIAFQPRPAGRFNLKAITHTMMQPRLAMTAAMAFFSITLTLNLTGVHLSDLRAADLTPSNLKHSFYHANASVVRYYTNLRVVYELESRVNEIKRNDDDSSPPAPKAEPKEGADKNQDKPRKVPKSGSGTSERRNPLDQEFKLARYDQSLPVDRLRFGNTARATPTNKLTETLQEGDLV